MAIDQILIDTNSYVAFKQGLPEAIEIIQYSHHIGISSVVLGELLAGFSLGTHEAENKKELQLFLSSPRITILSIDETTARFYASIYKALKNKGKPIPTNDLWIAATTLQHNFKLFSYDSHFNFVDDLIVGKELSSFVK